MVVSKIVKFWATGKLNISKTFSEFKHQKSCLVPISQKLQDWDTGEGRIGFFYASVWKLYNLQDLSAYFRQFSSFPYLSDKDQPFDFRNVHPTNIKSYQKPYEKYKLESWAVMRMFWKFLNWRFEMSVMDWGEAHSAFPGISVLKLLRDWY